MDRRSLQVPARLRPARAPDRLCPRMIVSWPGAWRRAVSPLPGGVLEAGRVGSAPVAGLRRNRVRQRDSAARGRLLMCFVAAAWRPPASYLLPWFAGMKFGPALLIPYLWMTRPETRRPIVTSCAIFAAACLVSFAVAPGLWFDYAGTFGWEASSQMQAMFVLRDRPQPGRSGPGHPACPRGGGDPCRHPLAARLAGVRGGNRDHADLLAHAPGGSGWPLAAVAEGSHRPVAEERGRPAALAHRAACLPGHAPAQGATRGKGLGRTPAQRRGGSHRVVPGRPAGHRCERGPLICV